MRSDERYPITTLHRFLEEASKEFRRYRFQAKLNLIGAVVVLLFLVRFLIFISLGLGPPPFGVRRGLLRSGFFVDLVLLIASLGAVLWSLDVWRSQRKFVSRWGVRFEKLQELEGQLLSDNTH